MFKNWKCDEEEWKQSSFFLDSDSDDEFQIDENKCHKCDVPFKDGVADIYRCDHCP